MLLSIRTVALLAVAVLAGGCASIPMDKTKVQKLSSVEVARVPTPPIQAMTFMQALVKSPAVGAGLIPAAIAESQAVTLFSAPSIPDLGVLLADGLRKRLPQQAPWFPRMEERAATVDAAFSNPGREWLRIEILQYEIAPVPLRTVFAVVNVSLRDAGNQPLWTEQKAFSGVVHGGEKIDMAKLPGDLTQLRREVERAAEWLVNEIAAAASR